MFILLASICFIGVLASPISSNKRDKRMLVKEPSPISIEPGWPIYHFCGYFGDTCTDNSDCCPGNTCGYPNGYDYSSTRCCGETGTTGCNATAPWPGTGCCYRNYCAPPSQPGEKTMCLPILTKKKRLIQP